MKLHGNAVLAVFAESCAATRAALRMQSPSVRAAVHAGPAMMATIQDRLDYFGRTVHFGAALVQQAAPGEIVVSDEVGCDPGAEEVLRTRTTALGVVRLGPIVATRVKAA